VAHPKIADGAGTVSHDSENQLNWFLVSPGTGQNRALILLAGFFPFQPPAFGVCCVPF
jgi:hypothetical protein